MKSIGVLSALILIFGLSNQALADQCAYITKEQALMAISKLNLGQTIYHLCELCGDIVPSTSKIESLSVETAGYKDYWQIKVNSKGIDLAYVFIDNYEGNKLLNLAVISNCPTRGVNEYISK
jgi:hypothetical protein